MSNVNEILEQEPCRYFGRTPRDLLNQLVIKLKDVSEPELVEDNNEDIGYGSLLNFKKENYNTPLTLQSIKVVINGLLDELNYKNSRREAEKMARAYYTSFCNG